MTEAPLVQVSPAWSAHFPDAYVGVLLVDAVDNGPPSMFTTEIDTLLLTAGHDADALQVPLVLDRSISGEQLLKKLVK